MFFLNSNDTQIYNYPFYYHDNDNSICWPSSWPICYHGCSSLLEALCLMERHLGSICFSISIICISTGRSHSLILGRETILISTRTLSSPSIFISHSFILGGETVLSKDRALSRPSILPVKLPGGRGFLKGSFSKASGYQGASWMFQLRFLFQKFHLANYQRASWEWQLQYSVSSVHSSCAGLWVVSSFKSISTRRWLRPVSER